MNYAKIIKLKFEKNLFDEKQFTSTVEGKFKVMYDKIKDMTDEQAEFNSMIKTQIDGLGDPTKTQIDRMKHENTMIHRELERTQDCNRKLITELNNISFSNNA